MTPIAETESEYRYEWKYLVDQDEALKGLSKFQSYLQPELKYPNYTILNLYFDTFDLTSLQQKDGGDFKKTKYRLRTYSGSQFSQWKPEVKLKFGDRSRKSSGRFFSDTDLQTTIDQLRSPFDWPSPRQQFSDHEMRFPKLWVKYRRHAYTSWDRQVRVTFDDQLSGRRFCSSEPPETMAFSSNKTVFEVKHGPKAPYWLDQLKATLRPYRASFSKYAHLYHLSCHS
ncbi:MAG: hypothetical protein CL675_01530 [Bdellovibrionaceae bacterium]|nr:hypothetical protein [Pseudobdellovibrionaceae bacterium]